MDVTGCTFATNTSTNQGGAIHFVPGSQAVTQIAACIFTQNTAAESGGAVFEDAPNMDIDYINSLFDRNTASGSAASGYGGGAIFSQGDINANHINCTFVKNLAIGGQGGGIRVTTLKKPNVINCIFFNNGDGAGGTTKDEEAQIFLDTGAVPVVKNCAIEGCDDPGFCEAGTTNTGSAPSFVDFDNNDYRLMATGNIDLIDKGDGDNDGMDTCMTVNTTAKDLDGSPRFRFNGGQCLSINKNFVDMGAYEVQ